MGQSQSIANLSSHALEGTELTEFENKFPYGIDFDPNTSFLLSYGVDQQHYISPKSDAKYIRSTFNEKVGVPLSNIQCFIASESQGSCDFQSIHQKFLEAASQVQSSGIFVFSYSGYGIITGNGECGLAPTDHKNAYDSLISPATIREWLNQANFEGRCVILVLDLCFDKGKAETVRISQPSDNPSSPQVIVFTSCTADAMSCISNHFQRSMFSIFFDLSLQTSLDRPGFLELKRLYDDCFKCCEGYSSLLISYDPASKELTWTMMQLELKSFQLAPSFHKLLLLVQSDEEVDSNNEFPRFEFLCRYYDSKMPKVINIPDKCLGWLEYVSGNEGPLETLKIRGFNDKVVIISSMMYSMASFFAAHCRGRSDIPNVNTFIVSLIHVLGAIDKVFTDITITPADALVALHFYASSLRKVNISSRKLTSLYNQFNRLQVDRSAMNEPTAEETDSHQQLTSNDEVCVDWQL
jgi:hypothetical protein